VGKDPRRRDDGDAVRIVEERQRRRWLHAARNPEGARGLPADTASLVVEDAQASTSSSLLVSATKTHARGPSGFFSDLPYSAYSS
jgi:hypothetical protein